MGQVCRDNFPAKSPSKLSIWGLLIVQILCAPPTAASSIPSPPPIPSRPLARDGQSKPEEGGHTWKKWVFLMHSHLGLSWHIFLSPRGTTDQVWGA